MGKFTLERLEEAKEVFDKFRDLENEIKNAYKTYKSPRMGNDIKNNTAADPVEKAFHRIESLNVQVNECLDFMEEFEDDLANLSDIEIASIIRWHYILGLNWRETSKKVTGYNDYSYARKKIMRYLEKTEGQD